MTVTDWQEAYFDAVNKVETETIQQGDLVPIWNAFKAMSQEIQRLREALKVYAGPMAWENLEGGPEGWGKFPVWADGYPGGVFIDDNTLDFGETARAALEAKQ